MFMTFVLINPSSAPAWTVETNKAPSPCPATLRAVICLCGEFLKSLGPVSAVSLLPCGAQQVGFNSKISLPNLWATEIRECYILTFRTLYLVEG